MRTRSDFDAKLNSLPTVKKAYYRPPESLQLMFPCIVYDKETKEIVYADDEKYLKLQPYSVLIIDREIESTIPDALEDMFRYCKPGKPYSTDGLSYWPYTIYY